MLHASMPMESGTALGVTGDCRMQVSYMNLLPRLPEPFLGMVRDPLIQKVRRGIVPSRACALALPACTERCALL